MDLSPTATAVLQELERVVRARTDITYGDLSKAVDGLPARGSKMTATLLEVSEAVWQAKGVLLTVLVVNAGNRLPSDGFYELVALHRPEEADADRSVLARRERERVYRAYPG